MRQTSSSFLTSLGLVAFAAACSTPSTDREVQRVDLPPGSIGQIDTQTVRSLPYTLREDNLETAIDTPFVAQFGNGQVQLPLDAFYGAALAGHMGGWSVDGRGHAASVAGSSMPGFVSRLEVMPDGPIAIGQTWDVITPSDAEVMASPDVVMQLKRTLSVTEAFTTPTGFGVRIALEGWSRLPFNPTLTAFAFESGMGNPMVDWKPRMVGEVDVDLGTGTVLAMRIYEELMGDHATPGDMVGQVASTTYCIDPSSGFTARADLCAWNQ